MPRYKPPADMLSVTLTFNYTQDGILAIAKCAGVTPAEVTHEFIEFFIMQTLADKLQVKRPDEWLADAMFKRTD